MEIESADDEDYIPDCDDITSESSEVSMTQEELEAAYGGDSEDEEKGEEYFHSCESDPPNEKEIGRAHV